MPGKANKQNVLKNQTVATPKQAKVSKKDKKEAMKTALALVDTDYLSYIKANDPAEIMKDSIDVATTECSTMVQGMVTDIAKNAMGFHGGLRHMFSSKSSVVGNDLRDFLKLKTREWVNNMVQKEQSDYEKEKKEELDNDATLSPEQRLEKMEEFQNDQRIKGIFLKSTMYDQVKKDVVKRLEKESVDFAGKIDKSYQSNYSQKILTECQKIFENEFKKSAYQNRELPKMDSDKMAKEIAVARLALKAKGIGEKVFEGISGEIGEKARSDVIKHRDNIVKNLGGQYSKNHMRAEFDKNKNNPQEEAEDYVYGDASGQYLQTGIQSKEEKSEEIKRAVRKDVFVSNNVNKGLYYFSKGIFSLVHDNGDTLALEGGLKIPVHEGVFIIFNIGGEIEKDDDHVTGKVELSVGASGDVGIANISGEVGGFMEISAKTPDDFANLISYMLYRQFRESHIIPHALTDAIWGMGGRSGEDSYHEAEAFGAMSEKKLFGSDVDAENVAKLGMFAKLGAEVGFEDAGVGVSAELKGAIGREYSKTSFEERNQEHRIGKMEDYKFGGQKSKGQITGSITVGLGAEAALGGGGAELEVNFRSGKISDLSVSLTGSLSLPGGAKGAEMIASYVLSAVKLVGTNIQRWIENIHKMKKEGKFKGNELMQALVADVGGGALETFQIGFAGKPLTNLVERVGDSAENISSSDLELELTYEWERGTYGEFSIGLNSKTSIGADFGLGSFKLEKGKNIMGWSTKDAKETQGNLAKKIGGGFSF